MSDTTNQSEREDLAACLPCGCWRMVMVIRRPASRSMPAYEADAEDLADFYASVAKEQRRKKNPLNLTVIRCFDDKLPPDHCSVCRPQTQASLFDSSRASS